MKEINTFESIRNLIAEAKEKNKLIFAEEISHWITPTDLLTLVEEKKAGYLYTTLTLKDPMERINELENQIKELSAEIDKIRSFIS